MNWNNKCQSLCHIANFRTTIAFNKEKARSKFPAVCLYVFKSVFELSWHSVILKSLKFARLDFFTSIKIYSNRGLQDCDTVQWFGRIPTFRRTMLPPSSGWKWRQLVSYHVITWRHNPEHHDLILRFSFRISGLLKSTSAAKSCICTKTDMWINGKMTFHFCRIAHWTKWTSCDVKSCVLHVKCKAWLELWTVHWCTLKYL
jgi:hypothetical protein